jgi:hypothetical protein
VTGVSESDSILYRVAILMILVTKINKLTIKRERKFIRSALIYVSISSRWALWALALGAAPRPQRPRYMMLDHVTYWQPSF